MNALPTRAGAARLAQPDIDEELLKPMKLRDVLYANHISHPLLARSITKPDGTPLSRTAVSTILSRDIWPASTPREWIEKQIRDFLNSRGISSAADADLFGAAYDPNHGQHMPNPAPRGVRQSSKPQIDFDAPEPAMLTLHAKKHFKLFQDPFRSDPDSIDDVFMGPDQAYVFESLLDAVRNHRLFALVGESGAGKTTLVDALKQRIRDEGMPVLIVQPMLPDKAALTARGILEAIVRDLAPAGTKPRGSNEGLSRQAHQLLLEHAEAGQQTMLMFEEAHDLSLIALKQLKRFHELKSGWKRLLSIILVGQPELSVKLGEHATGEAREVARRLEIVTLMPLDGELDGYVKLRLARAGVRDITTLFAPDAFDAVRARLVATIVRGQQQERVSMTYPLLVGNLLSRALNEAAHLGAERVDANIVRGC
jgi:type II secretory pathway predicted ATPase ExeA